jgi:hypothetical protein
MNPTAEPLTIRVSDDRSVGGIKALAFVGFPLQSGQKGSQVMSAMLDAFITWAAALT